MSAIRNLEQIITTVDQGATQLGIKTKIIQFFKNLFSKCLPLIKHQVEEDVNAVITSIPLDDK